MASAYPTGASADRLQRSFDELRDHLDFQFAQQAQLFQTLLRAGISFAAESESSEDPNPVLEEENASDDPSEASSANPDETPAQVKPPNPRSSIRVSQKRLQRRPRASVATLLRHVELKEAARHRPDGHEASGPWFLQVTEYTKALVEATGFSALIFGLILVNAILLGVEIDYASTLPEADIPAWLGLLNAVIVCVFVLEIILKLIAYGCRGFWRGPQAWWNIFDFFIVAVSALETVLDLWARSLVAAIWGSDAFSVVRTMRLARALRGMRFLRVFRYFSALRVLVLSIVSTINSLLWTIVLLFIIFYSFGVILTQLVTDYCRFLAVEASNNMNAVPECPAELDKYWSSIGQSMLTLFYAITNGVAWSDAVRPLEDVSLLAVAFVIFYIIISVFTLLNVVTGVFVNTAIERASADKDIAALKAFQKRKEQIQVLRHAFEAMDHWQTNNLKIKDIEEAMGLESVGAFLESLDISTDDIRMLFTLIDADNSGTIDLEEFVSGCMQLHGPAKSLQLAKMSYENKLTRNAVSAMAANIRAILTRMEMMVKPSGLIREPL